MNELKTRFNAQKVDIQSRAAAMLDVLVSPQFHMGVRIADAKQRQDAVMAASDNSPLFSSIQNPELRHKIALINAEAVEEYAQANNDTAPPAEMLACAHEQIENCFTTNKENANGNMLLSSLGETISTSDGIDAVAVSAALALPLMVINPMNDIVTYLPAKRYKAEVFEMQTKAASTLGDVKKGDDLGHLHNGQYSQMQQRYVFPDAGDGTKTTFAFDTVADTPAKIALPLVKGSVTVYVNREAVAVDDGQGELSGKIVIGGVKHAVNGTVEYTAGVITPVFTTAPPADAEVFAEYEIDVESKPELIPSVSHELTSFFLTPKARVIAADANIQAMFKMFTEHSIDMASFNMRTLRTYLSNEKSYKQLSDLVWFCNQVMAFDAAVPTGESKKDHYEYIRQLFLACGTDIMTVTGDSGLKGIYAGRDFSLFIRMLPTDLFKLAPNYEQISGIHFVGTLMGFIKVFECPDETVVAAGKALAYGKSKELGKAPYYTGDVVPPMILKDVTKRGFKEEQVVYALGYDRLNPNHGRKYLRLLDLKNFQATAA